MDRVEHCISFVTGKAAQNISRLARDYLAKWDLTPVQFAVLQALRQKAGQSASELGAFLVIDSATITGIIDRLCKSSVIERRPDPKDRRITRLFLTPAGEALIGEAQAVMTWLNGEVLSAFGTDATTLWSLLERLASFKPGNQRPDIEKG